jgi:hypothetical protein
MNKNHKALLILERPWWDLTDESSQTSVLPFFEGLAKGLAPVTPYYATFFCRESFRNALDHLMTHSHDSSIIYIASHGEGQRLHGGGNGPSINLTTALIEVFAHASVNKNIDGLILGSCYLGRNTDQILSLFPGSGLRWVVGYQFSMNWLESTLVDMNIVRHMAQLNDGDWKDADIIKARLAESLRPFNGFEESAILVDEDEQEQGLFATDQKDVPRSLAEAIQCFIRPAGSGQRARNVSEAVIELAWINDSDESEAA